MKKVKQTKKLSLILIVIFAATTLSSRADEGGWLTSYDEALKQATEQKKDVYVNFTGSDW